MSEALRISRQMSVCAVMETIVHCSPISRASISKQTGLSKQTISEIVRQLENDGWVRETGRTSGHVGRTALTYEIVPDAACIAVVDVGGTKVRAAIADLSCQVLAEMTEPTDHRGAMEVIKQICRLCKEAARKNAINFQKVRLVVVGVPGVPDLTSGRVLLAPNIPGFDQIDVAANLEAALQRDVILENDVNLAGLGEHWIGSGVGIDNLAFIALGTGIGSGILVGGELVRGHTGAAGELGYLPLGADPFEPESVRAGAMERVVATDGIQTRFEHLTGEYWDVRKIFNAAMTGHVHAGVTVEETARYLARTVAAICAIANPGKVILGGSIGSRPELIARVRALMPQCFPYPVDISPSALGAHAALAGGAAIGLTNLHATLFSGGVPGAEIALPPADVVTFLRASQ